MKAGCCSRVFPAATYWWQHTAYVLGLGAGRTVSAGADGQIGENWPAGMYGRVGQSSGGQTTPEHAS